MGDGKALQMGTSHDLGQNFAKVFDITYLDANGDTQLCWTTSWGVSTRMVGGLIMAHGDDQGLVVPPALAPIQAVVLLVRDEDGAGDAGRRARRRAEGRRRAGAPRRPGRHQLRPPRHRLGDQGRPRAHRGRPPRPGRGPGHHRAPRHRREAHRARRRGRAPGHQPARPDPGRAAGHGHQAPRRAHRRGRQTIDEAIEAGKVGFARSPGTSSRTGARPASPRTPSPSAASRPPTAASPPARTTPTSSPTSPGATDPRRRLRS